MAQEVNRLYWINDNGDWELVLESPNDKAIMFAAECRISEAAHGVIGYAKYHKASDWMRWTMYRRHEGGLSRAPRHTDAIPKAIQLLEFLL